MVKLELLGVSSDGRQHMVLMRHEERVLPIVIGISEAQAIHSALTGEKSFRPMTHDLICNLLAGLRGTLQSVTIYKLEDMTFFAHLNIEQRNSSGGVEQVLRVDTRPSDGIAIAARIQCPIFAAEEVMDQAAQEMPVIGPGEEEEEEPEEPEE